MITEYTNLGGERGSVKAFSEGLSGVCMQADRRSRPAVV